MKKFIVLGISLFMLTGCGVSSAADSVEVSETYQETDTSENVPVVSASQTFDSSVESTDYDVDLTVLSSSMVYAQVYDMVTNSESYMGQSVKMRGPFNYYLDPETGKEYFAVMITDATACCSQGIEFVLEGDYKYPEDYPAIDTEITVTGNFNCYKDGIYTYCQLTNAEIVEQ